MKTFRPKYITFDCYGTLTWFQMSNMTRELCVKHVPSEHMDAFVADFAAYRFDEVLGAWKPYETVVKSAFEPSTPYYGYSEITDIGGLPGLVGL